MLRVALGCLLLAVAVYVAAFHLAPAHELDASLLAFLARYEGSALQPLFDKVGALAKLHYYAVVCVGVGLVAWRLEGLRAAAVAALAIAGANLTTQLLKAALAEPRPHDAAARQVEAASWPSGHVTGIAIAVLVVLLLVRDPLRRPLAIGGAMLTLAMAVAVVAQNWHYPSDALGGVAVAGAWASAAGALLSSRRPAATAARRRRWPRATG